METYLGHGALESNLTHTDVQIDNLTKGSAITSFDIDYSGITHDNQRAIGICTAADVADAMHKIFGFEVSEQFIYVLGKRLIDKNTYEGSSIKTMLQIAYKYGAPRKVLVPTDDTRKSYEDYIDVDFSPEVYADALKQKIAGYAQVKTDWESIVKAGSLSSTGIQFMIRVGDNFYAVNHKITWDGKKLSPLQVPNPITGAHSIKAIKGSLLDGAGTFRNTWGDRDNLVSPHSPVWGTNGDIDFNYNVQSPYIVEAWTILETPANDLFIHQFTKPINYGDKSSEVTALQRVLTRLGFYHFTVTGNYFQITTAAVLAFQQANGITGGDGKSVGPKTREMLNKLQ